MANPVAEAQLRVRREAEEMQDFLSGLAAWEDRVKAKDEQLKAAAASKRGSSAPIFAPPVPVAAAVPSKSEVISSNESEISGAASSTASTPEEMEREAGNAHYKRGEFALAIKRYTRAVALNPKDPLGYSNRAMAHLKVKEFTRAQDDACAALSLDPCHVKSLLRRATAENALGRHTAAEADLLAARDLEPGNKQVIADLRKTLELRKAAIRRAPRTSVTVSFVDVHTPPVSEEEAPQEFSSLLDID